MVDAARIAARVEHIEAEAWAHLQLALPAATSAELRTQIRRDGTAICLAAPGADVAAMNLVLALGFDRELSASDLRAIRDWYTGAGVKRWLIEWSPHACPVDGERLLIEGGGARKGPTVKLYRALTAADATAADAPHLEIREIGADEAALFEATVAEPLALPRETAAGIRSTVGDPNWHFYLAVEQGEAIAGGALFVHGDGAWLGLAATAAHARGRGAQTALLKRRIRDAHQLGCGWASADTHAETAARPNPSLRNMLRVGFQVLYHRPKYLFEVANA